MAKSEGVSTLTLHAREKIGTTGANAVRRDGRVPGVLFGHGSTPVPIAVEARALAGLLSSGGTSRIVDATLGGTHESVLLREVQRDPITRRPLTADFQRVSQTEAIQASVPIVTVGVARGVRDSGGVMDIVTHALDIKGPAGKLPQALEVDVSDLGVLDHITAGDVPVPEGFTLITPRETTVVAIEIPRAAVAETEVAAPVAEVAPAPEA
jgi:large subunit ribosomal protein L25